MSIQSSVLIPSLTLLPSYSDAAGASRTLHTATALLDVDITGSNVVPGATVAFLPGSQLAIRLRQSRKRATPLADSFSSVEVVFFGYSSTVASGTSARTKRVITRRQATAVPVTGEQNEWTIELGIPLVTDCTCEWLASQAGFEGGKILLPPSLRLVEEKSYAAGRLGAKFVVEYMLQVQLKGRRLRPNVGKTLSIPISIESEASFDLDGRFIVDSTDLVALESSVWHTLPMIPLELSLNVGRGIRVRGLQLEFVKSHQSDVFITVTRTIVTFAGVFDELCDPLRRHILTDFAPTLWIGRRVLDIKKASLMIHPRKQLSSLRVHVLSHTPMAEQVSLFPEPWFEMTYKRTLKVLKDDMPDALNCDGVIEVYAVAEFGMSTLSEPAEIWVKLSHSPEFPPAYNV